MCIRAQSECGGFGKDVGIQVEAVGTREETRRKG